MIDPHLPALQVVVPLLAAPLCLLLGNSKRCWLFTLGVSWVTFAIAVALLHKVTTLGTLSYALGGWAAPIGIEYRVDWLGAFVALIVSGISSIVLIAAGNTVRKELEAQREIYFYTAYLLCLAGLLGITVTGDAFNLFVFLEISSLSSYTLIALGQDRRALTASYRYLIMGTIGATFFIIGVGLLYVMTGTLNMSDLAQRIPAVEGTRTIRSAFAFVTVGLSIKLALFPLHSWLPNAYTFAPSVVTAFLAATATKVAVYALLRFLFTVFGLHDTFELMPWYVLLPLALLGVFTASSVAIYQHNVKRMLAYSSVAQIGYMILGVSFTTVTGLTSTILHLFNHALMKGALFLALTGIIYRLGSHGQIYLVDFRGLGQTMPWTMVTIVIGGLSLIGIPLTVGFISKWYLVLAALEINRWPLAILVLLGSLLAVIYIWRLVETAYFKKPNESTEVREAPASILVPTWLLITANVYFGIDTQLTVGVAQKAAQQLIGASP